MHTDVGEFLGLSSHFGDKDHPFGRSLMLAMNLSGLFDDYVVRIATSVYYPTAGKGDLFLFADGPEQPRSHSPVLYPSVGFMCCRFI